MKIHAGDVSSGPSAGITGSRRNKVDWRDWRIESKWREIVIDLFLIKMLWSVLSLQTKMVAMFGCAIIIALSILIIICFLIPDSWWILPWAPHQAGELIAPSILFQMNSAKMILKNSNSSDEDQALNEPEGSDVRLRDFHQWRPEDEDHPAELMDSRNKSKKPSSSSSRLSRNELCYDSSGYSVDSGRPGSLLTGGRESSLSSNGSSVVSSPSTSSSRVGPASSLAIDGIL